MINFIAGGIAKDYRGQIKFVNDFDMSLVKRFYIIKNADTELVRGWRAHQIEQRWFYVLSGSFSVDIVQIDNWEKPSNNLPIENITISDDDMQILHVPIGFGTAFRALEANSELLVYADYGIENASNDDHTYPLDYFVNRQV
ncbi:WxcM-like domain-containing protein [Sphingobacterium faecium]|uniref:WxcM-like domain-containing protein n=1 Tax=Sphingobacterium faecium TaxID=34087 RepID=UPI00247B13F2|nr:WxcM-like domain-containing protein [Sphingobacterium faecium]WGQ12755.1 WxcM-like domain-containing protein [Sphingobacterium faecium]